MKCKLRILGISKEKIKVLHMNNNNQWRNRLSIFFKKGMGEGHMCKGPFLLSSSTLLLSTKALNSSVWMEPSTVFGYILLMGEGGWFLCLKREEPAQMLIPHLHVLGDSWSLASGQAALICVAGWICELSKQVASLSHIE